jgi:hypothetical protein
VRLVADEVTSEADEDAPGVRQRQRLDRAHRRPSLSGMVFHMSD